MIKEIGEFIIFLLEGLSKILKFVLFKFGLWVPLLFSTLFLVVLAITKTPFESVAGLFWFGVILTAILSLVATIGFAISRGRNNKKDTSARSTQSAVKEKGKQNAEMQQNSYPQASYPVQNGYPYYAPYPPGYPPQPYAPYPQAQPQPVQSGYQMQQPTINGYQSEQAENVQATFTTPHKTEQSESSFESFTRRSRFGDEGFSAESYSCPQGKPPGYNGEFANMRANRSMRFGEERVSGFGVEEQSVVAPKIFRTRKDPSILVYDYPDRVEFYRKTANGLTFLYKENKNR